TAAAREPGVARRTRHLEQSRGLLRQGDALDPVRVFEFVHAEKANHKIAVMCRVLDVSKSGCHAWVDRPPSQRSIDDTKITAAIEQVWERSRRTYGQPREHVELRLDHHIRCCRKRVARLMR